MKSKRVMLILIILLAIILISVVIFMIHLNNKEADNEEDIFSQEELGEEYNRDHLNNFDFDIIGLDREVQNKINNMNEFVLEFKEYIYLTGLVDADKATYVDHEDNVDEIIIEFKLNNSKQTIIYATIDLRNDKYSFNHYNPVVGEYTNHEKIARKYLEEYQSYLMNDSNKAYQLLDTEYREKRFNNSFQEFERYIAKNLDKIENITLSEYSSEKRDRYTEYTCVDTFENYYIIKLTDTGEYSVILDNYIIKTDDFLSIYKGLSEQEKAVKNMHIFVTMLNMYDYNSAYNVLANSFKDNYFRTRSEFDRYIENNFFSYNVLRINQIKKESGLYVIDVTLATGNNAAAEIMQKTFIMQLQTGIDFVVSFNVD